MIPVYQWLNVASVNAYVSGRIYPFHAGDSPTYPYITFQPVSSSAQQMLAEVPEVDNERLQIDCWSRDLQTLLDLAVAIRTELDKHGHQITRIDSRDPDTKSYRVQFDYSFWRHR